MFEVYSEKEKKTAKVTKGSLRSKIKQLEKEVKRLERENNELVAYTQRLERTAAPRVTVTVDVNGYVQALRGEER